MKLVLTIVHADDASELSSQLAEAGFGVTRIKSLGGFLKKHNATFLMGVTDHQLETVLQIIRDRCHVRTEAVSPVPPLVEPGEVFLPYPVEVEVGGATVFVLNVERFERL
ncbi:MAG TPA: cyclic-di-AMP receptor [Chloroflexota bacterium]|nr:cyclic-di-AMP receptor [Chloroflexota bacterium]